MSSLQVVSMLDGRLLWLPEQFLEAKHTAAVPPHVSGKYHFGLRVAISKVQTVLHGIHFLLLKSFHLRKIAKPKPLSSKPMLSMQVLCSFNVG